MARADISDATTQHAENAEAKAHAEDSGERSAVDGDGPVEARDAAATPSSAEHEPPPPASVAGAHEIETGRIIDGRYRVEALLGEGAVGLVYRCRHLVLDKDVAIKVLRPDFARDPELSGRLVLEAKAASAIGNPHIVETVDFGTLLDGTAFFAMEYLDGAPLSEVIETEAPLSREALLHIAIQIAEALEAAHRAGIVHRDLKPDNVFIVSRRGDDKFVKIVDFGIAKLARAESKLTRAGQIYGTPHYMSPEQASGRATDERTDVYAVGILLFEMATGHVPFDAEEPLGILSLHLHSEPPSLMSVATPQHASLAKTQGLDAVVRKCLAKNPADRYQTMFELRADLCRIQGGLAPVAPGVAETKRKNSAGTAMSNTTRGALALAAVATLAAASLGYALYSRKDTVVVVEGPSPPARPVPVAPPELPRAPVVEEQAPSKSTHRVVVVVIPHDARVRRGDEDIGPMPVTLEVPDGQTVHLSITRSGYVSRRLAVDGSRDRIVVGLVPERAIRGGKAPSKKEAEAQADEAALRSLDTEELGFTLEPDPKPAAPAAGDEATPKPAPAESTERKAAEPKEPAAEPAPAPSAAAPPASDTEADPQTP